MNREEKNQQTRRRILDSALAEFAKQGYGSSSVNTICSSQDISKGIIYHYFKTKDELYLSCIEECFHELTAYLRQTLTWENKTAQEQLEQYFTSRVTFFQAHPLYQPIFCEAIISPPNHLKKEIQIRRQEFDDLTVDTLTQMLRHLPLCPDVTIEEVVETFREFQDFINAKYSFSRLSDENFQLREKNCRKILNILLYGVIERRSN